MIDVVFTLRIKNIIKRFHCTQFFVESKGLVGFTNHCVCCLLLKTQAVASFNLQMSLLTLILL